MKVCFFSQYSITNQAGATLSMFEIMKEMVSRGIEVSVVIANTNNISKDMLDSGINFIVVPFYGMRMDMKKKNFLTTPKFFVKYLMNKLSKRKMLKQLTSAKPDIIHINGLDNAIGSEIAQKLGIPYVWHIRQFLKADFGQKLFEEKHVYGMVSKANSVIAISNDVKVNFEPIFKRDLEVVYNGVPKEAYVVEDVKRFAEDNVKMLLAGRIAPQKGQLEAVKAVEILRDRNIGNVSLTIIGEIESWDYLASLKEYINSHELGSCVTIVEHTSDLRGMRKQHDIGLTCSVKEAFGRVTIENMLANMLVIGADTGGTLEIIDDMKNGMLYKMGDAVSLADKIEYAVTNRAEALSMISTGFDDAVNKYSTKRVVDDILRIYDRITK